MLDEKIYTFRSIPRTKMAGFDSEETQKLLAKWSIKDGLKIQAYSFDAPFKAYHEETFVKDFFSDPQVVASLMRKTRWGEGDHFSPLGMPCQSIKMEQISCSETTMALFDRLTPEEGCGVSRKGGDIVKCAPQYVRSVDISGEPCPDELEVSDELRKMLMMPQESDHAELFTPNEKSEFIYLIFGHLVLGGILCQWEDNLEPYLEVTRLIYKDLVRVVKDDLVDEGLRVTSHVIRVHGAKSQGEETLWTRRNLNNFLYLVIDSIGRTVWTFYHHV